MVTGLPFPFSMRCRLLSIFNRLIAGNQASSLLLALDGHTSRIEAEIAYMKLVQYRGDASGQIGEYASEGDFCLVLVPLQR
jgi:hypothetical protein